MVRYGFRSSPGVCLLHYCHCHTSSPPMFLRSLTPQCPIIYLELNTHAEQAVIAWAVHPPQCPRAFVEGAGAAGVWGGSLCVHLLQLRQWQGPTFLG